MDSLPLACFRVEVDHGVKARQHPYVADLAFDADSRFVGLDQSATKNAAKNALLRIAIAPSDTGFQIVHGILVQSESKKAVQAFHHG